MKPILIIFIVISIIFYKVIRNSAMRRHKAKSLAMLPMCEVQSLHRIIRENFSDIEMQLEIAYPKLSKRKELCMVVYTIFQCLAYIHTHPQFHKIYGPNIYGDLFYALVFSCEYFSLSKRPSMDKDSDLIDDIYKDAGNEIRQTERFGLIGTENLYKIAAHEFLIFLAIDAYDATVIDLKKRITEQFETTAINMDNVFNKYAENHIYERWST